MMIRIGDFARLAHISIKTLRYYDRIGLLRPAHVDDANGYRYYSLDQLPRVNRILVFKGLGFPLEHIEALLNDDLPVATMRELLSVRRTELERQIHSEQQQLAQIEARLSQLEERREVSSYEILLKQVEPGLVASVRDRVSNYDESERLFNELEGYLQRFGIEGKRAAIWHSCAGSSEIIDCEAFLLLPEEVPASPRVRVYELPEAEMATVIHQGRDETSPEAFAALRGWIESNRYEVTGPIRELYWNWEDGDDGLTEVQIPVAQPSSA